jgi:hypothetical protein
MQNDSSGLNYYARERNKRQQKIRINRNTDWTKINLKIIKTPQISLPLTKLIEDLNKVKNKL